MNTSEDRMVQLTLSLQMRERWLVVVECTAYFSVVLTAFVGNLLFTLTFYKIRTLRTPQNYYLVSLAVTDILNAAACIALHLSRSQRKRGHTVILFVNSKE